MTSVSLYVELKAKPGKENEVASFLASAQNLVAAEPGTIT
jgi:quinol monooxygenase YgiN